MRRIDLEDEIYELLKNNLTQGSFEFLQEIPYEYLYDEKWIFLEIEDKKVSRKIKKLLTEYKDIYGTD